MAPPLISILMPVYNAAATLREAVDSIRAQTISDYEFLTLDDGSSDDSLRILRDYAAQDPRMHVLHHPNCGIALTLNKALPLARGQFIARMDADDISLPQRLATQLDFLAQHPEIALVGAWDQNFGGSNTDINRLASDPSHLKASLLFRNPMSHSTILWRREWLAEKHLRYDPACRYMEDYDLWARVAYVFPIANIPQVLSHRRWSPTGINATYRQQQVVEINALQRRILSWLKLVPSPRQQAVHEALAWDQLAEEEDFLRAAHEWLLTLRQANLQNPHFEQAGLMRVLTGRWIAVAKRAAEHFPRLYAAIYASPFLPLVQCPLPLPQEQP